MFENDWIPAGETLEHNTRLIEVTVFGRVRCPQRTGRVDGYSQAPQRRVEDSAALP
jgi:hypothetical protein